MLTEQPLDQFDGCGMQNELPEHRVQIDQIEYSNVGGIMIEAPNERGHTAALALFGGIEQG